MILFGDHELRWADKVEFLDDSLLLDSSQASVALNQSFNCFDTSARL
jgi:hypothetical protein